MGWFLAPLPGAFLLLVSLLLLGPAAGLKGRGAGYALRRLLVPYWVTHRKEKS